MDAHTVNIMMKPSDFSGTDMEASQLDSANKVIREILWPGMYLTYDTTIITRLEQQKQPDW